MTLWTRYGALKLACGRELILYDKDLVVRSPTGRTETRFPLTNEERERLADLLLSSVPRDVPDEDEASDLDDEVVQ